MPFNDDIKPKVQSVNGKIGDVTLTQDDIPDGRYYRKTHNDFTYNHITKIDNATAHIASTSNPHNVTKAQVGLSNVDNTSDANKPISTATQTALDSKQATISDLETIRSNSNKGSQAKDTIDTYGNIVTHNTSEFATAAQGTKADSAVQPAAISDMATKTWSKGQVIDNISSTTTDQPLSANMGKELQDQINNLKAIGRFLSTWNCVTGLPGTDPTESPYTYKTGDYYVVNIIASAEGEVNHKPDGSQFIIGQASTVVETNEVAISDYYVYDGSVWKLLSNTQKTLTFANIAGNPYDNTNLSTALTEKVTANGTISGATKTKITYDSKGLVTAGADLAEADIPSLHLTKITDVTATASELNVLDGITATTTELNYVDGVTSNIQTQIDNKVTKNADITAGTHTKITYDAKGLVTSGTDLTASDIPSLNASKINVGTFDVDRIPDITLSKISDVTATASELNVLDGITATTQELNYTDGVTSNIQTQLNDKQAKLPEVVNDRYLHTNSSTGALEWSTVSPGGGGTVTSVGTGTGLTGGPITTSGTISVDTTVIATKQDLTSKQDTLVSGTNIKTINNESLLGSGNIQVQLEWEHVETPWDTNPGTLAQAQAEGYNVGEGEY